MPLTKEQVDALLKGQLTRKTASPRTKPPTGRRQIQYPTLTAGGPITQVPQDGLQSRLKTERCTSRGCSSPSYFRLYGAAKCMTHLLTEVSHLLMLTKRETNSESNKDGIIVHPSHHPTRLLQPISDRTTNEGLL